MSEKRGIRDGFLAGIVIFGVALVLSTEILSLFSALRRPWILFSWLATIVAFATYSRSCLPLSDLYGRFKACHWDWVVVLCCLAIGVIAALTGLTAAFSPPNSSDAMAYHMPRVIFWAEQHSVRFFPTQYLNQIMLQPLAEYAMLHLYLLTGADRLINFVQWFAALGSIVGVSAVAARFGWNGRGQAFAALFCATIPGGILAASGAKNDWALSFWLIAAVYFALQYASGGGLRDAIFLGAATGCAVLTKATAYLFLPPLLLPPLLIAIFAGSRVADLKPRLRGLLLALLCALAINAPQYWRNYQLSGSVLGFDSAQGDGFFRWRNESFGWKQTTSNVLRNISEQMGARSERWNQGIYQSVLAIHRRLNIDVNDPATTWRWTEYHPPKNANHEADAPNRWHLFLLMVLGLSFFWHPIRTKHWLLAIYAAGIFTGFAAFCFYLKWQPFMARLFLPLFVAGAPLTGVISQIRVGATRTGAVLQLLVCAMLVDGARLPALQNWVRPLQGPKSVLHVPREDQYFADLGTWHNQESYMETAEALAESGCAVVGLDITNLQLEYPLMALLRSRKPEASFVHTGVENASRKYPPPVANPPCAVVCLDCAGDLRRTAQYANFPHSVKIDKFILYTK